jgi:hypothetical protein
MRNVAVLYSMGIFGLWTLLRIKDQVEQIRRNQLTPTERAAEDTARIEEQQYEGRTFAIAVVISVAVGLIILIVKYLMNGG